MRGSPDCFNNQTSRGCQRRNAVNNAKSPKQKDDHPTPDRTEEPDKKHRKAPANLPTPHSPFEITGCHSEMKVLPAIKKPQFQRQSPVPNALSLDGDCDERPKSPMPAAERITNTLPHPSQFPRRRPIFQVTYHLTNQKSQPGSSMRKPSSRTPRISQRKRPKWVSSRARRSNPVSPAGQFGLDLLQIGIGFFSMLKAYQLIFMLKPRRWREDST